MRARAPPHAPPRVCAGESRRLDEARRQNVFFDVCLGLKKCAEDAAAAAAVPLRGPLLNETHATIRVTALFSFSTTLNVAFLFVAFLFVVVENTSPPHPTALKKKTSLKRHSKRFTRGTRGAPSCR